MMYVCNLQPQTRLTVVSLSLQINFDEIGKKPWISRQPQQVRKAFAGAFACTLVGGGYDAYHVLWSHEFLQHLAVERLKLPEDNLVAVSPLTNLPDKTKAQQ